MNKEEFITNCQKYLNSYAEMVASMASASQNITIDHIAYKCASSDEFLAIRSLFEFGERFLYQSVFNGRRVAYIGLENPLNSIHGAVHYIELFDTKSDTGTNETGSIHHIEVYSKTNSYDEMLTTYKHLEKPIEEEVRNGLPTHDILLGDGIIVRLTRAPLVEKLYRTEMVI